MCLAVSYTNEGMLQETHSSLNQWLNISHHVPIFTSNQHDQLLKAYLATIQKSHLDPDLQIGLGLLLYNTQEYSKTIDCFQAALALRDDYILWNRLGAVLSNSGQSIIN